MIIILGVTAGVAAAGAWLRWAILPARIAYGLGRLAERQSARLRARAVNHAARRPEGGGPGEKHAEEPDTGP